MDILIHVLNIVALIVMSWFVLVWLASQRIKKQIDPTLKELEQERLIPLTVEVEQDQYLCYNCFTQAFVCQGRDLEEIIRKFKQRYPDKSAAIYNGDETAVKTLRAQLETLAKSNSVQP